MLLLCVLLLAAVGPGTGSAWAQDTPNRAALVVRFGDGSTYTECVEFNEESITGEQLLQRVNLDIITDYNAGLGGAVCSIDGSGCAFPADDCFCKCQGSGCEYWAYYHWQNGKWQYSPVGASSYAVTDGALEGWSWGQGDFNNHSASPPAITFDQICASQGTQTVQNQDPAAPDVMFEAIETSLAPGACTVLNWTTYNATQVTLNGAAVSGQDRKEVCLAASERFVLAASNAAGQTTRELVVSVAGVSAPPTEMTPVTPQQAPKAQQPAVVPTIVRETPIRLAVISTAEVLSTTADPGVAPASATDTPQPAATEGQIEPLLATITPTQSVSILDLLGATATATSRPRQQLGTGNRVTPTPILLARAQPARRSQTGRVSGLADDASSPPRRQDRGFRPALLPGYASFALMAASLLAIWAWATWRRIT